MVRQIGLSVSSIDWYRDKSDRDCALGAATARRNRHHCARVVITGTQPVPQWATASFMRPKQGAKCKEHAGNRRPDSKLHEGALNLRRQLWPL